MSDPDAAPGSRPVVVTGGAGFIGCNLVDRLAQQGHRVLAVDTLVRRGSEQNAEWLRSRHRDKVILVKTDVRDFDALHAIIADAGAVFHFAAQVAVTTSFANPLEDFSVNAAGALNLLESARRARHPIPVIFASTNKVYGDLGDLALESRDQNYAPCDAEIRANGINERRPLDFHTPYGCSKGAADQYVLDYARSFGLPAAVMRMSCIYGPRQMGNEDQGWVAHFLIRALAGEPVTLYGDGLQVRDVLYIDDAVEAYLAAWRNIERVKGSAFNLGGGPTNAISLKQLLDFIARRLGRSIDVAYADWRPGDQRYFVSDSRLVRSSLGLRPFLPWREGVDRLIAWLKANWPLRAGGAPHAEVA